MKKISFDKMDDEIIIDGGRGMKMTKQCSK